MWSLLEALYYVLLEPVLVALGLVTYGAGDPTYGRDALPYSELEKTQIYANPAVRVTRRRVYLAKDKPVLDLDVGDTIRTLPHRWKGKTISSWVNYYVWEMPEALAHQRGTLAV